MHPACLFVLQVSFVNGIATTGGGSHVDYVTNQIATYVIKILNMKMKNVNVDVHNVKNHLWVFVNVLFENPAFDSQTKDTLTTDPQSFGSKCEFSDVFLKKGMLRSTWSGFVQFSCKSKANFHFHCSC